MARLEQRIDAQERLIEGMMRKLERDGMERLVRELEVDVAAMIAELRVAGHPQLLRGRRATLAHTKHGANLSPEARREIRRQSAAATRARKPVGHGKGAVRDPETRRRARAQAQGG